MESRYEPKYRYGLRAKIHESGFRTLTEFSKDVGVNIARISRICSGLELPSVDLSRSMSSKLKITLSDLHSLL